MFKKREEMTNVDRLYNARHNVEIQKQWLEHTKKNRDRVEFSDYERAFLYGVSDRIKMNIELTDAQIELLEELYNRC